MRILNTIKFIINHPLTEHSKTKALGGWLSWQIGSRLVPGPVVVPFVNDTKLIVYPGMTGATGNIYTGLHEFNDMAFVLHMLRSNDLFVDVGANVGSYTVLAAGVVGTECLAVEPIPQIFRHLLNNIYVNNIGRLVDARHIGIGSEDGVLPFVTGKDAMNHVAVGSYSEDAGIVKVAVTTLDNIVSGQPRLIKIDVEGFEAAVLCGAHQVLSQHSLVGVIMELNGSGRRYGFDDFDIHNKMLDLGFKPYDYEPFKRTLVHLKGLNQNAGNTIYIRDYGFVLERLATAQPFTVRGKEI